MIEIPVQCRPVYAVANFADVRANVVYTRRGSSNAEASPDEIARMGATTAELAGAELEVAFAVPAGRQILGRTVTLECSHLTLDEKGEIPDYEEGGGFRLSPLLSANRHYWRELVAYITTTQLARPVALTVTNRGKSAAREVRVELVIDDPDRELIFIEPSDIPERPTQNYNIAHLNVPQAMAAAMKTPRFEVECVSGTWHLAFNLSTLQPSRAVFPAIAFFAGSKRSKSVEVTGRVLADNLPSPAECSLSFHFNTTSKTMNLDGFEDEYSKLVADDFEDE